LVYKRTCSHEDSQVYPQMVLVVLRIQIHVLWIFVSWCVVWSVWLHGCFYGF